ncbi:hypothetical protein HYALB_00005842 [Hymenoscyphus albidus]|uniref:Major facilitator superfamily (MFS) profile domain-containing protein n=1 Tax=Hymenoscyphus albidus TaxID=595503 RepID=A0A9N9LZ77_9HELO|nr:hypothetical protein HYALB_00005842 [Hymenoscyphus albidus]
MMAVIYIYIAFYSGTWGPINWVYMGEIFPTRIRDYGMAISVMLIWVCNFVVSKQTPIIVLKIGWKTWMIFGAFNAAAFVFSLFLPETRGVSLENMDILFKAVDETKRQKDIEDRIGVVSEVVPRESTAASEAKSPTLDTKELS